MLDKIIKKKIFCGLDVGSQQVKASLISVQNALDPELLGVAEARTDGLKNASVSDLTELTECINLTVSSLVKKTGVKIKDVQLGVGGEFVESRLSTAVVPLADKGSKVITQSDMKKVNYQARLLGVKMEEEVLHDFPQYYRVDDMNPAFNPAGLYGRKLEVALLMVVARTTRTSNVMKAVNQAGYDISHTFFSSFAAAEACLSKKNKVEGSVLVDIGSSITSILIFKDGLLRHMENIPLGGDHVTRSIAHGVNLSFDLAEDIKKSYAVATTSDVKNDEEILVKKETSFIPIKRELICQSIEQEITKLVMCVDDVIKHSKLYEEMNAGIIMVGGGALLPGLIERVESRTSLPVSMGKPNIAAGKTGSAAVFMSAVGLAQLGQVKMPGASSAEQAQTSWRAAISNKMKEVYQEYF